MGLSKMFAQATALSALGTPYAKMLPKFLTNNPLPNGQPWGTKTVQNTNPYEVTPDTGVTRTYEWTVSEQTASPDGVPNKMLLVNGQYPGPTLEANWGDQVEVTVHNNLTDEGTGFHWHGLLQKATPWMDGVPGIDQCPIAPASSFTYKFQADLYGSSWYHAHYEGQYASGLVGPMVIYGPLASEYDIDVGPVLVSDYYHTYYKTIEEGVLALPPVVTPTDNNLINGKNSFNGNGAPLSSFNFTSNKKMRLRLINTSAFAVEKVSIDGHNMSVIANDFVPVKPYTTDVVTLSPGQRTDVIVQGQADATGAFWLRAYKPATCSPSKPTSLLATAGIFYEKADRSKAPTSTQGANAYNTYCGNDALSKTVPLYPITPAATPGFTEVIPLVFRSNGTSNLWYMQNRTARVDFNDPALFSAAEGDLDFPEILNAHNYGTNASVRVILENPGAQPHPIHFHGHNFWVLQEGACNASQLPADQFAGDISANGVPKAAASRRDLDNLYEAEAEAQIEERSMLSDLLAKMGISTKSNSKSSNANTNTNTNTKTGATATSSTAELGHCWDGTVVNPSNPQRRDVHMLLPGHYAVIQWNSDNPGVWPLHCHIAWHLSNGFLWTVVENPAAIKKDVNVPAEMPATCTAWQAWTNGHVVDQIDDGI